MARRGGACGRWGETSWLRAGNRRSAEEIVHRLVTGLHPHKIVLFGSYVYGTPTADSDVDLLVIVDTQARPVDRYLRVSRLLRPRPFPLDLLVKTPQEVAQALDRDDAFMREIMARGRVLYERSD